MWLLFLMFKAWELWGQKIKFSFVVAVLKASGNYVSTVEVRAFPVLASFSCYSKDQTWNLCFSHCSVSWVRMIFLWDLFRDTAIYSARSSFPKCCENQRLSGKTSATFLAFWLGNILIHLWILQAVVVPCCILCRTGPSTGLPHGVCSNTVRCKCFCNIAFGVILVLVVRTSSLALLTQPAWCLSPGKCSGCGIKCLPGVPTKKVCPDRELAMSHYSLMRVCAEASHQGFLMENHMANGKGKMKKSCAEWFLLFEELSCDVLILLPI